MAQKEVGHTGELISEYSLEVSGGLILVTESSVNHQVPNVLEFGAFLFLFQTNYTSQWSFGITILGIYTLPHSPPKRIRDSLSPFKINVFAS